jgi:hypothetical protein
MNVIMLSVIMLSVIMLSVIIAKRHYAERHYAESRYAKCHYAEYHYTKCHSVECHGGSISTLVKKFAGKAWSLPLEWSPVRVSTRIGLSLSHKIRLGLG